MIPLSWKVFLLDLMLMLLPINTENLSERSAKYIQEFQEIFPHIDIKSEKVYEFVEDEANLKRVIILNTKLCSDEKNKQRRVSRSVYSLMAIPIDLMYSTTHPTTYCNEDDPDRYGYIDQSFYNNVNLTSSELALSREGWDYSPYVPPGETTTEFVFPSWNYDGKCPEAFWKEWTGHEQDLVQSTFDIPDNVLGFTDAERQSLHSFADVYNGFWDSIFSIRHKCDNYTTIFECMQGKALGSPNMLDVEDDPVE